MQIVLYCFDCACHFGAPSEAPAGEVLDRMTVEGPWFALGEGDNFEEMVAAALAARGRILCPECGEPVCIDEESPAGFAAREAFRYC